MTYAGWCIWGADAVPGFSLHKLLDDSVLQRMITDHHQSALKAEQLNGLPQGCFQVFKFVVNSNSQCLECLRGRMQFASSADSSLYKAGQLACGLYGAFFYDTSGDLMAVTFFSVRFYQVSQSRLRGRINNIGGRNFLVGVESHIQGCIKLKAEATAIPVELKGGDAKVEQDAMYRGEIVFMADGLQINEVIIDQAD